MKFRIPVLVVVGSLNMASAFGTDIVAHRGASHDAPENTLASVALGWKLDADAVEIDIHLSADGRIVVLHDKNTKRTAGKDRLVSEQTLDELRQLDAGSWKGKRYAGEKIPTLEEVLATIPDGKRLYIEIKTEAEIVPELARVLKQSGKTPEQTVLIGFSYEAMRVAKQALPGLKSYWLVSLERDKQSGEINHTAEELIEKTKAAGFDGLDLGSSPPLTREFVDKIKKAGLELHVWTVNDPEKARAYKDLGIDSVTTDRPDLIRKALEEPAPSK